MDEDMIAGAVSAAMPYRLDHLRSPRILDVDPATAHAARISMMRFRLFGGGPRSVVLTADPTHGTSDIYEVLASWFNRMRVSPEGMDLREITIVVHLVATDAEPLPVAFSVGCNGTSTLASLVEPTRQVCAALLVRWGIADR